MNSHQLSARGVGEWGSGGMGKWGNGEVGKWGVGCRVWGEQIKIIS